MATSKAKPKKAKRRLKNLVIDEISLVDNPAVPEAEFLIAKRDQVESLTEFDTLVNDVEQRVTKSADSEQMATEDALRFSAEIIGLIRGLKAALSDAGGDVASAVTTLMSKFGVSISLNGEGFAGMPVDMAAAAVYQNTKSDDSTQDVDDLEKAQRVLSAQQFKALSGACDVLKDVVGKARKIGKTEQVGEVGEASQVDVATALDDAPTLTAADVSKDVPPEDAAASDDEPASAAESVEDASELNETKEAVEVVEDADVAVTGDDTPSDDDDDTESVAEKVAKLWRQRQQQKVEEQKRADEARLNAAATRLGDSLNQLSLRLDRIAVRVGSATGSAE